MALAGYKQGFIEFLVRCDALRFGSFTTKSGRQSPYFLNFGQINTGVRLARTGAWYAEALATRFDADFDCLYGPAYKGIPLATSAGFALAENHGHDVGVCFNRKEAKDHGEGGSLVGHRPKAGDRVVIVEDVTTAGTSIHETFALFRRELEVEPMALIVGVDRQERGAGKLNAQAELRETYGLETLSVVTLDEIVAHLHNREIDGRVALDDALLTRIEAYRSEYGA